MKILVIDAQGGGVGKQLIAAMKQSMQNIVITAVGTNSAATSAMLKAGADFAATGENAVVVACRKTDVIVGPVGIVIADALLGEITPRMAVAVAQSDAKRILLPFNHCNNIIAGVSEFQVGKLVQAAIAELTKTQNSCKI
ncbi:MAG: DUF3842 family protein [Lachnospiraceae bacterium]|nr:DUF3842 family protein [Lachnospiraceae bacterium]